MATELDPLFVTRRHSSRSSPPGWEASHSARFYQARSAAPDLPGFAPKAKRVIYLFMSGGPSQLDLFDDKPLLAPAQRRAAAGLGPRRPAAHRHERKPGGPAARGSHFKFAPHGKSGTWVSELLPHTGGVIDDFCFIRSMFTEAINHDPAMTFLQTGSQIAGTAEPRVVDPLRARQHEREPAGLRRAGRPRSTTDQPLYARLWGSGFLDSRYQGVRFRPARRPVFYLANPDGICGTGRRALLDELGGAEPHRLSERNSIPEIETRIAQYEMAFRMQTSVPELTDLDRSEPKSVLDLYGPESSKPGTFAANCLLARRLAERGVRFIQLYHPRLGPAQRPAAATSPKLMPRHGPALRRR